MNPLAGELGQDIGKHEIKFLVPSHRVPSVAGWLNQVCRPDPDYPRGKISTIYYDTMSLASLREKINSDYNKRKLRVRWYQTLSGNQAVGTAFAEIKVRVGSRRKKLRVKIPHSPESLGAAGLDDPALRSIPALLESEGVALPRELYPVVLVSYQRHRFVELLSGSRLSLDFNISAPKVNRQVLPRANPLQLNTAVFELKGELTELPPVLYRLADLGCRKGSFSKYAACCQRILSARW